MNYGQILWRNLLHEYLSGVAYDGTEAAGFEVENAADWLDYSLFRANSGTSHVTLQVPVGVSVDTVVAWPTVVSGVGTVYLDASADGLSWSNLTSFTRPIDGSIYWKSFTAVAISAGNWLRLRLVDASAVDWRQLSIGAKITFPIGQWSGLSHPKLAQGVVADTVIAMNGSILGRNVRRLEKRSEINLEYLTPDWVRNTWDPFAQHATRKQFWWRWNPTEYEQDVAFAAAEEIVAPTNDRAGRMKATMPVRFLT